MISKLLLLPFRALLAILSPWYLRWIFRLNWVVYVGLAFGIGYLAYQEYETYRFNVLEAEIQIDAGPPATVPLSEWNSTDAAIANAEVSVEGIYFAALPQGRFDWAGVSRRFILLADDRGREVKAVLVADADDLPRLQRQLAGQGDGDSVAVVVNGTLNSNSNWLQSIRTDILAMNLPGADDLVVIEPFVGTRAAALRDRAEKTVGVAMVLAVLAGFLALVGAAKFALSRRSSATQSQMSAREVHKARQSKQPTAKALPNKAPPSASPWGTFQAQPKRNSPPPTPNRTVKSPVTPQQIDDTDPVPVEPAFASVFPSGGSAFRFKSADEIIRQSFGTLSTLTSPKHDD